MAPENTSISAVDTMIRKRVLVADNVEMAYIDTDPLATANPNKPLLIFLHGMPMSSYIWRNIIPHVQSRARCVAPDLIGMGASQKLSSEGYGWQNHVQYLNSFFDSILRPEQKVILVLHDFGSLFGFHWAHHHAQQVVGLVFMEFLYDFPDWYATNTDMKFAMKLGTSDESMHKAIVEDNIFIEEFIQAQVVRELSLVEMNQYRAPFLTPEDRLALLELGKLMPVKDFSPESFEAAEKDQAWLAETEIPKLYFWADPGKIQPPSLAKELSDKLKNITNIAVGHAKHFLQEDHPQLIGEEITKWLHRQEE